MKFRIREIRKKKGIKQAEVAARAGLSQPFLSLLERNADSRSASTGTLDKIANVLDVRIGELFDDARPVAIAGKVGAGAKVPLIDAYEKGDGLYHVACPPGLPHDINIVGVEVEGDSMMPTYQHGDVLFYSRDVVGVPAEAIGVVCVCEDENGDGWVKWVKSGSEPGKFHLISLNPMAENMFDVALKWAAPVRLAWPRDLVERI